MSAVELVAVVVSGASALMAAAWRLALVLKMPREQMAATARALSGIRD
jgi:hypothetical protein